MAITLVGANLVWQRVREALSGKKSVTQKSLRELKLYLATYKGNPKLSFLPIDGTYSASDGGTNASQVLADAPCTLYAIVLTKVGATETIFKASNHTTTAGTNGTQDSAIAATAAGDVVEFYPDGRALSAGLTVTENTTRTGSTLTLTANRMDGFAIIGQ